MFGAPGLKVGNKAFAMLVKGRLVVKLPRELVQVLVATGEGEPGRHAFSGRLMKEWVAVGPGDESSWLGFAEQALDFVASAR